MVIVSTLFKGTINQDEMTQVLTCFFELLLFFLNMTHSPLPLGVGAALVITGLK